MTEDIQKWLTSFIPRMEKYYAGMGAPAQLIPTLVKETVNHEQESWDDPTSFEIDQLLISTTLRHQDGFRHQQIENVLHEEEDRTMHEAIQSIPFQQRIAFLLHTFFNVSDSEIERLQLDHDDTEVKALLILKLKQLEQNGTVTDTHLALRLKLLGKAYDRLPNFGSTIIKSEQIEEQEEKHARPKYTFKVPKWLYLVGPILVFISVVLLISLRMDNVPTQPREKVEAATKSISGEQDYKKQYKKLREYYNVKSTKLIQSMGVTKKQFDKTIISNYGNEVTKIIEPESGHSDDITIAEERANQLSNNTKQMLGQLLLQPKDYLLQLNSDSPNYKKVYLDKGSNRRLLFNLWTMQQSYFLPAYLAALNTYEKEWRPYLNNGKLDQGMLEHNRDIPKKMRMLVKSISENGLIINYDNKEDNLYLTPNFFKVNPVMIKDMPEEVIRYYQENHHQPVLKYNFNTQEQSLTITDKTAMEELIEIEQIIKKIDVESLYRSSIVNDYANLFYYYSNVFMSYTNTSNPDKKIISLIQAYESFNPEAKSSETLQKFAPYIQKKKKELSTGIPANITESMQTPDFMR
jgi:hypothetical protein